VHAFASLHTVPFGAFGFEHVPFAGLHTPATWHWSLAAHTTGFAPVQTPAWQVSVRVHEFPSVQAVPFATGALTQAPFTQLSVVHVLLSLQSAAVAQANPVLKASCESFPTITSCAEIAPEPSKRSAERKTLRAMTSARSCTSVPSDTEFWFPSMRPLTITRRFEAGCGAGAWSRERSACRRSD
jgi:hypothetical protein